MSSPSNAPEPSAAPSASAPRVTLFTDRSLFAHQWSRALEGYGLDVVTAPPSQLPRAIERGAAIVVDAGAEPYDDDELLAHVGLARALGAIPVVAVPPDVDLSSVDDILDELCPGLVSRRPEDVDRVVATLARRTDPKRGRRFEYLTVSPRGGELLAIFSDGNSALVKRPVLDEDDGSPVVAITFGEDATSAVLALESGRELLLTSAVVADKSMSDGATNGAIDGVMLGRRIRELRLAAGLTQAELARRTGIHRPNIARVEAGRHTPSLETLARLAHAIGVPTRSVLGE